MTVEQVLPPLVADIAAADSAQRGGRLLVSLPIMLTGVLFCSCLVLFACGLMAMHTRAWRRAASEQTSREDYNFAWGQYRRRMQTSMLMAMLGVAMFVGLWITDAWWFVAYWLGVMMLVAWMVVAALMDAFWTRQHYSHIRQRQQAEAALLRSDLRRLREGADTESASSKGPPPPRE